MLIAKVENNQVIELGDYRDLLPHVSHPVSGPDFGYLNSIGWYEVSIFKSYDRQTQKLTTVAPYFEDNFVYTVIVEELTGDELLSIVNNKALEIRNIRNNILSQEVDKINAIRWEAMTEEKRQEWRVYRQALLDIPAQETFPLEVVWPTQP